MDRGAIDVPVQPGVLGGPIAADQRLKGSQQRDSPLTPATAADQKPLLLELMALGNGERQTGAQDSSIEG